jgi:hypothetical protein
VALFLRIRRIQSEREITPSIGPGGGHAALLGQAGCSEENKSRCGATWLLASFSPPLTFAPAATSHRALRRASFVPVPVLVLFINLKPQPFLFGVRRHNLFTLAISNLRLHHHLMCVTAGARSMPFVWNWRALLRRSSATSRRGGVLCESLAARRVSTLKLTNCFLDPRSDD